MIHHSASEFKKKIILIYSVIKLAFIYLSTGIICVTAIRHLIVTDYKVPGDNNTMWHQSHASHSIIGKMSLFGRRPTSNDQEKSQFILDNQLNSAQVDGP